MCSEISLTLFIVIRLNQFPEYPNFTLSARRAPPPHTHTSSMQHSVTVGAWSAPDMQKIILSFCLVLIYKNKTKHNKTTNAPFVHFKEPAQRAGSFMTNTLLPHPSRNIFYTGWWKQDPFFSACDWLTWYSFPNLNKSPSSCLNLTHSNNKGNDY